MKNRYTRSEKIRLLKGIAEGKISPADLRQKKSLIVVIPGGTKYYLDDEEVSYEEYLEEENKHPVKWGEARYEVTIVRSNNNKKEKI